MAIESSNLAQTNLLKVDWSTLPKPEDDGAADHLIGANLPAIPLPATNGATIDLAELPGRTVVFAYPMTGHPETPLPDGWDMIPGARGCTPQACSFRDLTQDLQAAGVNHLFGLSTQSTDYQKEAAERLHLPFPLLSDENLDLTMALKLPTMGVDGMTLMRRLTMVIHNGTIDHVFYPVFPPDQSAATVLHWLLSETTG